MKELNMLSIKTYSNAMKWVILFIVINAFTIDRHNYNFYYITFILFLVYMLLYNLREVSIEYKEFSDAFKRTTKPEEMHLAINYQYWRLHNRVWIGINEAIKKLFSR